MKLTELKSESIELLTKLITIPSFSREEDGTAQVINDFLIQKGVHINRKYNNIWAYNKYCKSQLPTILLNSHHDTVKPNNGWDTNPFEAVVKDGKLYGLGSNDAGGALVSLIATFLYFYERQDLKFNLIIAATAEEEITGDTGVQCILNELAEINLAIVGEPTNMKLAVAEKGLLVVDCIATGKSGHAARDEGENAIINAFKDINWFHSYTFPQKSKFLGPIMMNVTMIEAGTQHNVIPDVCEFTVDIRTTDAYSSDQVLDIIRKHVTCEVHPRSTRLNSSSIANDHPAVKCAVDLGIELFGSPTTSDQAVLNWDSVKIGPGKSERSHTSNEFIQLKEIEQGIDLYIKWIEKLNDQ